MGGESVGGGESKFVVVGYINGRERRFGNKGK